MKLARFYARVMKYKKEEEQKTMEMLKELEQYSSCGNPLFYKELIDRILNHTEFKEDFEFIERLDEIASELPTFKSPLPYPLSSHLQFRNGKWRLIPHTMFEPTNAQLEQQRIFTNAAKSIIGTTGLPFKKMAKIIRGKASKGISKKRKLMQRRVQKIVRREHGYKV